MGGHSARDAEGGDEWLNNWSVSMAIPSVELRPKMHDASQMRGGGVERSSLLERSPQTVQTCRAGNLVWLGGLCRHVVLPRFGYATRGRVRSFEQSCARRRRRRIEVRRDDAHELLQIVGQLLDGSADESVIVGDNRANPRGCRRLSVPNR